VYSVLRVDVKHLDRRTRVVCEVNDMNISDSKESAKEVDQGCG